MAGWSLGLFFIGAVCMAVLVSVPVHAANVPNFEKSVDFNVREQPVEEFLNALFQEIDVPVAINSSLIGNVNGRFRDSARSVFDEISGAFNVVVYYDGAVAQAYRKNEISRRLIPASKTEAGRVASIVDKMGLPDSLNKIELEDSGVVATGFRRFQEQLDEIITSVKELPVPVAKKKTEPEVQIAVSFPEESPLVYQVFKLKHAWATDTNFPVAGQTIVVPGVATLLNQLLLQDGAGGGDLSSFEHNRTLRDLKGLGLSSRKNSLQNDSQSVAEVSADDLTTTPRIVADSRLNAIVIRDKENKMPAYRRLIDSLDVESEMVEIEATIIDINTDKTRELGVNWRYRDNDADVLLGDGSSADQSLIAGNGLITPQGQGGILSFSLGEPANFLARVRALEQKGAARVISKPHVITLSDVEAVLAATTEFFVRVAGEEEVDLFNVPVGTTLRVTPHIFTDGGQNRIKLLVNIEDGSQTSGTPVDNIPIVERANISTQAVVNDGDSLLVGGLVRDSYRNAGYQVPVLGRIPLLGGLFRSRSNQVVRVERLFMITPRVASGIGFGPGKYSATLSGDQNQIVQDSTKRIDAIDTPYRAPISYWSEESRTRGVQEFVSQTAGTPQAGVAGSNKQKILTASADQAAVGASGDGSYAIIQGNVFRTPFKVEEWVTGN